MRLRRTLPLLAASMALFFAVAARPFVTPDIKSAPEYVARMLTEAPSLERGSLKFNHVALTFDGSWKCEAAASILDTLRNKGVRATFFISGIFIEKYPAVLRRIVAEGHEVGNHTYSHPRLTSPSKMNRKYTQEQLSSTYLLYQRVADEPFSPFWRAPYGAQNAQIRHWAAELGYIHVGWTRAGGSRSMDSLDWVGNPHSRLYRSADEIAHRIVDFDGGRPGGANGAIILMHLGSSRSGDYPYERIGWIIDSMRRKGYEFVTISRMLKELE